MDKKELVKKYYFFTRTLSDGKPRTLWLEVGDGWLPMIDELCSKIEKMIDEKYPEVKETFKIVQLKEKFAGMRCYVSSAPDEIFDLISEYEEKSFTICEDCGADGATTKAIKGGYWVNTLCDKCREERKL